MMLLISSNIVNAFENTSLVPEAHPQQVKGFYISQSTIYISKNSVLMVNSDLIIENSSIEGKGDLVMKSENPKNITSKNSTISKIIIDNPTVVKLKGELEISEKLIIKKGTFDVSESLLTIDSDNIKLESGGTLFKGKDIKFVSSDIESLSLKPTISNSVISISNNVAIIKYSTIKNPIVFEEELLENIFMQNTIQPPDFSYTIM